MNKVSWWTFFPLSDHVAKDFPLFNDGMKVVIA